MTKKNAKQAKSGLPRCFLEAFAHLLCPVTRIRRFNQSTCPCAIFSVESCTLLANCHVTAGTTESKRRNGAAHVVCAYSKTTTPITVFRHDLGDENLAQIMRYGGCAFDLPSCLGFFLLFLMSHVPEASPRMVSLCSSFMVFNLVINFLKVPVCAFVFNLPALTQRVRP